MSIDLAEVISNSDYDTILELFLRIDEIMADSVFTDGVFYAFAERKREMDRA